MADQLSKTELIILVERIMAGEGSDAELGELLSILEKNVPHPAVSDLIYFPKCPELSAAQVVEHALSYSPIVLGHET